MTIEHESEDEVISKSQIKREFQALQLLGKQLVELSERQLESMPLSERLKEAIDETRSLKHGALKRQLKYIGGLMADENTDEIRDALNQLTQQHKKSVDQFHELEQWRDQLLQDNQELFDVLAGKFAYFDRQHVNQLIRNAKKEKAQSKPPKSARQLFDYLAGLQANS